MFKNLLKNNMGICCSVAVCIILGMCAGAFTVNNLSKVQVKELSDYLGGFSEIYTNQSISPGNLFVISAMQNYKFWLFLFISGMMIIGLPAIYIICAARSFVSGFTIGVIISAFGAKGILVCLLTVVPTDFFKLSAFLFLGISAVVFSVRVFKLLARKGFDISFKESINSFLKMTVASIFLIFVGILYEVLLSPVFLRLILK